VHTVICLVGKTARFSMDTLGASCFSETGTVLKLQSSKALQACTNAQQAKENMDAMLDSIVCVS
jgi:hypothetical protein